MSNCGLQEADNVDETNNEQIFSYSFGENLEITFLKLIKQIFVVQRAANASMKYTNGKAYFQIKISNITKLLGFALACYYSLRSIKITYVSPSIIVC